MLMIQRLADGNVCFSLSGRIEAEDVPELERLLGLEAGGQEVAFEMGEVTLVCREAVNFLARCEAKNIKLENCPAYIREWIDAEGYTRQER